MKLILAILLSVFSLCSSAQTDVIADRLLLIENVEYEESTQLPDNIKSQIKKSLLLSSSRIKDVHINLVKDLKKTLQNYKTHQSNDLVIYSIKSHITSHENELFGLKIILFNESHKKIEKRVESPPKFEKSGIVNAFSQALEITLEHLSSRPSRN